MSKEIPTKKKNQTTEDSDFEQQKWWEKDTYRNFNIFQMGNNESAVGTHLQERAKDKSAVGWNTFQAENHQTNTAPTSCLRSCLASTFINPCKHCFCKKKS